MNRVRGLAGIIFAALLCFALPAFGQNTNITFTGGTHGDNWCGGPDGCVGTGLYDGVINGTTTQMVCDDYTHHIQTNQNWTANGIDVASLTSTSGLQFASIGLFGYTELAYLVNQMFTASPNSTTQMLLSEAIWYTSGGVTLASLDPGAVTLFNQALAFANAHSGTSGLQLFSNLWLYTPNPGGPSGPQEMWGLVPVSEGGTALMYLLLAGVSCFGATFFRSHRSVGRLTA
jgi:hypothetical protein